MVSTSVSILVLVVAVVYSLWTLTKQSSKAVRKLGKTYDYVIGTGYILYVCTNELMVLCCWWCAKCMKCEFIVLGIFNVSSNFIVSN